MVERGLASSRERAQALILAGLVACDGRRVDKPGTAVDPSARIEVMGGPRDVGRGAGKLRGAFRRFAVQVEGLRALDCGSSTGGFTQVLLEAGAAHVVALDVGRGQLDWTLRNDPRVSVLEGRNARYLEIADLPYRPDLATIDVSFISLEKVLPAVARCLAPGGSIVALVKPQFEVGRGSVGKGGIVKDPRRHAEVLRRIAAFVADRGWGLVDVSASGIRGAEGNVEFFVLVAPDRRGLEGDVLEARIAAAVAEAQP